MYEFLPAIGSIIGILLAIFGRKTINDDTFTPENPLTDEPDPELVSSPDLETEVLAIPVEPPQKPVDQPPPTYLASPLVGLLIFWSVTSLLAYTVAGEKMPWLTVHISLPMILLSGWTIGYLVDTTDWVAFWSKKAWLAIALLFVFVPALLSTFRILLGSNPPFAGKSLDQLAATSGFIMALMVTLASAVGILLLTRHWSPQLARRGLAFVFLGLLVVLTAQVSFSEPPLITTIPLWNISSMRIVPRVIRSLCSKLPISLAA